MSIKEFLIIELTPFLLFWLIVVISVKLDEKKDNSKVIKKNLHIEDNLILFDDTPYIHHEIFTSSHDCDNSFDCDFD